MVSLEINGKTVEVEEETTIYKAAETAGIEIPTLCYTPIMEPYAACRICQVEIERDWGKELVTSCNTVCQEGMKIITDSEKVLNARRVILSLLLERCPNVEILREIAIKLGMELPEKVPEEEAETCILCGLCVRVCAEVVGVEAISFAGRGAEREVSPPFDEESEACITCGACFSVCPTGTVKMEDAFGRKVPLDELTVGPPKAIAIPTYQSVPNVPFINTETCIHFQTEGCKVCAKVCEPEAINYEMEDEIIDIDVGTIVISTGFQVMNPSQITRYGYGKYPDVITSADFEKMTNASGLTDGKVVTSKGEEPKDIAIIHCVGSRDVDTHAYCSRVCCMYALKMAHIIKEKTSAEVYQFYIDMRAFGKGYEEFYSRLLSEDVRFIRGKPGEVTNIAICAEEEGKLIVSCEDTLAGGIRRIPVDMVVLCPAIEARDDAREFGAMFGLGCTADGFFLEKHPKLAPIETASDGIYLAGACQGPKDIPDSVAQGGAAGAAALSLIDRGTIEVESATAMVVEDWCSGCKTCNLLCPYSAIEFDEKIGASVVNEALCKGCGTCVAACPSSAIIGKHFTDKQILAEIEGALI